MNVAWCGLGLLTTMSSSSSPWQLTFIGGEKMTEVFIHSLELGHSAATRAIKASGL